jgi:predicted alpha/beta-hydrolase family hydrolase
MRTNVLLFSAALLVLSTAQAYAQATKVKRTDGVEVSALIDLPSGSGKAPAVILASGQGYHMALPAMESTARALAEQGFAVFRFNWTYFTAEPRRQPSPDLSVETQDLEAMIAAARVHERVDERSVSVGGKSLGSVVAWRAFVADPKLRAALLLTPVCSRVPRGETSPKPEAQENYPGLESERRPTLWIAGDSDPLCSATVLYDFAATGHKATRVVVVGGDHSFENKALPASEAEAFRGRNLLSVSTIAVGFFAEVSRTAQ